MENESLTIEKLTGEDNWAMWKFQVRVLNLASGAIDILSEDLVKPEPAQYQNPYQVIAYEKKLKDWKRLDGLAQKSIATTVSPRCMSHIMNCDSARGMWLKLHQVYENQSETTKHMLQQKWFSLGRDAADDIATYIAKIKDIACRLTTFGEPVPYSMVITKILLTLPPSLKHFATAWESTGQDQRTLTNLISRLSMEEIRAAADEDTDKKAFSA